MTKEEFDTLFKNKSVQLFFYCKRILGVKEDAEDVCADSFIQVWKHWTVGDPAALLFVTARNRCINIIRRRHRILRDKQIIENLYEDCVLPYVPTVMEEYQMRLLKEVENLSPRRKSAFIMSFVGGMKNEEIAAAMGLDKETVSNHKIAAVRILKDRLSTQPIQ